MKLNTIQITAIQFTFFFVQVEQKQRPFKLCYTSIVYMAFNLAIISKMLVKLYACNTELDLWNWDVCEFRFRCNLWTCFIFFVHSEISCYLWTKNYQIHLNRSKFNSFNFSSSYFKPQIFLNGLTKCN